MTESGSECLVSERVCGRRWTQLEKDGIVLETLGPDSQAASAVARRYGIRVGCLYKWRQRYVARQLKENGPGGDQFVSVGVIGGDGFAELSARSLASASMGLAGSDLIEISLMCGIRIKASGSLATTAGIVKLISGLR